MYDNRNYCKLNMNEIRAYVCSPLGAKGDNAKALIEINRQAAIKYCQITEKVFGVTAKAPHTYIPLVLDDTKPDERELALEFGIKLLKLCDCIIVCGDRISNGMKNEIITAYEYGLPIFCFSESVKREISKMGYSSFFLADDEARELGLPSQVVGINLRIGYTGKSSIA